MVKTIEFAILIITDLTPSYNVTHVVHGNLAYKYSNIHQLISYPFNHWFFESWKCTKNTKNSISEISVTIKCLDIMFAVGSPLN